MIIPWQIQYFIRSKQMKVKSFFIVLCLVVQTVSGQKNTGAVNTEPIDTTFLVFKKELDEAVQKKDTQNIVSKHVLLADFYQTLGITHDAIQHYHKALLYKKAIEDTLYVFILNNLGSINLAAGQYDTAIDYLNEGLTITEKKNLIRGKAVAYTLLGATSEKKKEYAKAIEYQYQSLRLFRLLNDDEGLAVVYENIGSIYEDREQYDKAYAYFQKAYDNVPESNTDRRINILNNLGDVNRKGGDYYKAFRYTGQARDEAERTGNIHQLSSALKDLSKTYALTDDYEKAYDYLNESVDTYKEEQQAKSLQQMNVLQAVYGFKEREAKIELLTKQNELNKANQRTIIVVVLLVMSVFAILFLFYRKKRSQEFKIEQYKQKLLRADLEKKITKEENLQKEIQLKTSSLSNYSLHLAHKNKVLSDVSNTLEKIKNREHMFIKPKIEALIKEIQTDIEDEQGWTEFIGYFEQIHPDFFKKLSEVSVSELGASELRLCMLLRLNLTSREIAAILRITPDSIRIARYRLRKKLPLEKGDNLQSFILEL